MQQLTIEDIKAAGGIVHKDGNIFFTNLEKLNTALRINEERSHKVAVEMKYVVVSTEDKKEQIFIFPKEIDHDRFAEVLSYIKVGNGRNWKREFRTPVSAGFTDGLTCYGHSENLGLKSRDTDTALLVSPIKLQAYIRNATCRHCQRSIMNNGKHWVDETSGEVSQYCFVDMVSGSRLHEPAA